MSKRPGTVQGKVLTAMVAGLLLWSAISHSLKPGGFNLMSWDNFGYYLYVPGAFTYGDLENFAFAESLTERYDMQSGLYQLQETDYGRVPIYSIGMAYLYSPFYLVAKGIARLTPFPDDGMSSPFQWLMLLAPFVFLLPAVHVLNRVLRTYVDPWIAYGVIAILLLGTNYFHYLTEANASPHAFLFSLYAFLIFFSEKWYREKQSRAFLGMCVVLFLLVLVRPTEIVAVLIPLLYGFPKNIQVNWERLRENPYVIPIAVLVGLVLLLPQLMVWQVATGRWLYNAYAEAGHTFDWANPHIIDGLFSYRKGWLVYTPVLAFVFPGLLFLKRYAKPYLSSIPVFLAVNIFVVFSWYIWWYASSFGSRPMTHCYPALALPLAALAQYVRDRSGNVMFRSLLAVAVFCVILNQFQSWQYRKGVLPGDGISKALYWKTFLNPRATQGDIKYVDLPAALSKTDLEKPRHVIRKRTMHSQIKQGSKDRFVEKKGYQAERISPEEEFGGGFTIALDKTGADTLGARWTVLEMEIFRSGNAFNAYNIARSVISVRRAGKVVDEVAVRFPFFLKEGDWQHLEFEYQLPASLQAGDEIQVFVWNPSPDTVFVRSATYSVLETGNHIP